MSKIWRYGDHVDTDLIIPARYLNISDPNELAEHAMEDAKESLIDPFAKNSNPGDIIVAGKNFGCGSSREHAPLVLKVKGAQCVIADSFARIFYRNAINIGLPLLEIGADVEQIEATDTLEVDMAAGKITIVNKGIVINCKPLPPFIQKIADCGGLIEYVKGGNL
ncbi:MAG: 3-isopropylmalate dehydratase small subunit [Phascolarctobacterium sp.]|nr:3-isopropylmalate dehydratase small subunit [Phascolarctobacterium sp.]